MQELMACGLKVNVSMGQGYSLGDVPASAGREPLTAPHGFSSTTPSFSIRANILRYSSEPSLSQYSVVRGES